MSNHDKLLQKARHSRALADRARYMSRHLSQSADIERVRAYASELDALAVEMERMAAERFVMEEESEGKAGNPAAAR